MEIPFVCTDWYSSTINKKKRKQKGIGIIMTSKQRAYLKSLASVMEPIFQIGKSSLTPEYTEAIREAFNTRELIKITVLKNCLDDPKEVAQVLADRTGSQVVQVIGRKIVLYKPDKDKPKIVLPK